LRNTPKVPKLALVKLASSHILELLGMTAWGVGSIIFNVQAKVKCDEDLVIVIQMIRTIYVKGFKDIWMQCDEKSASNKMVWHDEIALLMQYHE
jgi:hypothetical protein